MNRTSQATVVVLILAVVVAFGFRLLQAPGPATSAPLQAPPAPSVPASAAAVADASSGSLALRWVALLEERLRTPAPTAADGELTRSREREFRQELSRRLAQDPTRWTDVLEALSEEDPRFGRKIVGQLQDAVGEGGEKPLIALLRSGRHRETRIASATLLADRTSPDAFWALVSTAQEDQDSGVRYQALAELATRKGKPGHDQESATIDQVLRLRAQIDPDQGVRNFALRVTGQSPEAVSTQAPPSPKPILRSP